MLVFLYSYEVSVLNFFIREKIEGINMYVVKFDCRVLFFII